MSVTAAASPPSRVAIIHNPAAGGRAARGLRRLVAALDRDGLTPELLSTEAPGHAETLARDAAGCAQPPDILIAAGGDGTLSEVVNGVCAVEPPRPAVAVYARGTVNLLANELSMPRRPAAFARIIAAGYTAEATLGEISHGGGRRLFVMTAGIGFDARCVDRVSTRLKARVGRLAYAISAVQVLWRGNLPDYRVELDGRPVPARSLLVANGRYYAGRMVWAPAAGLWSAGLQVGLLARGGRRHILLCGLAVPARLFRHMPGVTVTALNRLAVSGPAGEPVQADGDIVARLPVTIAAAADRVRLVVRPG